MGDSGTCCDCICMSEKVPSTPTERLVTRVLGDVGNDSHLATALALRTAGYIELIAPLSALTCKSTRDRARDMRSRVLRQSPSAGFSSSQRARYQTLLMWRCSVTHPTLQKIAEQNDASVPRVVLEWTMQRGAAAILASRTEEHVLDLFRSGGSTASLQQLHSPPQDCCVQEAHALVGAAPP